MTAGYTKIIRDNLGRLYKDLPEELARNLPAAQRDPTPRGVEDRSDDRPPDSRGQGPHPRRWGAGIPDETDQRR